MNRVDELMVLNTISLSPNMSGKDAVRLLTQYKLDGAPVIASDEKVVGILTEYDLSLKGTGIHLPTLLKLFEEFDFYKVDKSKGGLATLLSMRVGDVMNKQELDKNVNKFLGSFENRFLFVSKSRTKLWLIFSLLFLVIGFFVAIASLVRIEFR